MNMGINDNDNTYILSEETVYLDGRDKTLEELYFELGKAYYEGGFEDPLPELIHYFDKITRLRNGMSL